MHWTCSLSILSAALAASAAFGQNTFPSSGNVGVGTPSPAYNLHIYSAAGSSIATIQTATTSTAASVLKMQTNASNWNLLTWDTANGANYPGAFALDDFYTGADALRMLFDRSGNVALGGNITDGQNFTGASMVIKGGSVGIGTTSPGQQLEVNGAGQIDGMLYAKGGVTFPDGSVQTQAFSSALCGGDYAESVDVVGKKKKYESLAMCW